MRLLRWIRAGCPGTLTWGLNGSRVPVRVCRSCGGDGTTRADGTRVRNPLAEANQYPCGPCRGRGFRWGDA